MNKRVRSLVEPVVEVTFPKELGRVKQTIGKTHRVETVTNGKDCHE